jgi:hypothetical protein
MMSLTTVTGLPILILLKLGAKEHLEMLRKGLLYMNPLAFFRSLEADSARGDPYEGTDSIIQPSHIGDFIIDPHLPGWEKIHVPPSDLAGPVRIALERTSRCNIFCLFTVDRPIDGPMFPKSSRWFGDSFLLFTNAQQFLSRVVAAAKRQGLRGQGRRVEYYDETRYSGPIGRFRKPSRYSYQREYRIALETGMEVPFRFEIGDLTDITSEVIPIELANDVLKFTTEDARAAGLNYNELPPNTVVG